MNSIRRLVLQVKKYLPRSLRPADTLSRVEVQAIQRKKAKNHPDVPKQTALLVAYNGQNYYGNNFGWDRPTIEGELLNALHAIGATPAVSQDICYQVLLNRVSRTDKGVSAAGNIILLRYMLWNQPDILTRVNSNLPPDIRVIDLEQAAKSFKDHKSCLERTYSYTLPTYAFAPLEERVTPDYRITPEIIERVNEVMEEFWGTHHFHNFTSTKESQLRGTSRQIFEFECGAPFVVDGVEFCVLRIRGQSFLLHQIRKMIGVTLAVVGGFCNKDAIHMCWEEGKMDIPKAPGLGLMLEELKFYKRDDMFGAPSKSFSKKRIADIKERLEDFREHEIRAAIIDTEIKQNSMMRWMKHLHVHVYRMVDRHGGEIYQRFRMIKLCAPRKSKESDFLDIDDDDIDLHGENLDQTVGEQYVSDLVEGDNYHLGENPLDSSRLLPNERRSSDDTVEERDTEERSVKANSQKRTRADKPFSDPGEMEIEIGRKQSV